MVLEETLNLHKQIKHLERICLRPETNAKTATILREILDRK